MKRMLISCLFLLLLVFAGCGKKDNGDRHNTFAGENEFWSVTYELSGNISHTKKENGNLQIDGWTDTKFTAEYKGDLSDLSDVKHIEIGYKGKFDKGRIVNDYSDGDGATSKIFELSGSNSSVYRVPGKEDTIQVEVNVDGEIQNFELKLMD